MSTELVERLRPSYVVDAGLQVIVRALREHGCEAEAFTLNEWIVANNARKSEAVDELTALTAKVALLTEALQAIIDMNVQYAKDKYGDASRADGMACVVAARRALSEPDKAKT